MSVSEIQKMFCPSCGAPIVFEEGREDTFCSHCGCQLHRDDENIVRRMEHIERKLEHEEKVLEYKDRAEVRSAQEKENKYVTIGLIVSAIVVAIFYYLTFYR